MAAMMLSKAAAGGYHGWFTVHRHELIDQSIDTLLGAAPGLDIGIVSPAHRMRRDAQIQVAMIQTLARRHHLLPKPDVIVVDECHHTPAASWAKLIEQFPDAVIIGLTATPQRLDGRGLGEFYEDMVCGPTTEWLIEHGFLCDYRLVAPPKERRPDLSQVHVQAGDLNKKETKEALDKADIVGDAVALYRQHASGLRNVLFTYSIESSRMLAGLFSAAGIPAAHLGSDVSAEYRAAIIQDFRAGRILVLCNVEIVTEGFDLPAIEAVQMLRPTLSTGLYLQMVGRALRVMPGKKYAVIIDQVGNTEEHGLPCRDREWKLEGVRRKRDDECPVKQCPQCFAMIKLSEVKCKWCGFRWMIQERGGRDLTQEAGELVEVDVLAKREERKKRERECTTLEQMMALGVELGFTNPETWARRKFHFRDDNWRQRVVNVRSEQQKREDAVRRMSAAVDESI